MSLSASLSASHSLAIGTRVEHVTSDGLNGTDLRSPIMYKTPRSALTAVARALNAWQGAPTFAKGRAVLAACDRARDTFEEHGWPDDWSAIQRAADDAAPGARYYGQ